MRSVHVNPIVCSTKDYLSMFYGRHHPQLVPPPLQYGCDRSAALASRILRRFVPSCTIYHTVRSMNGCDVAYSFCPLCVNFQRDLLPCTLASQLVSHHPNEVPDRVWTSISPSNSLERLQERGHHTQQSMSTLPSAIYCMTTSS